MNEKTLTALQKSIQLYKSRAEAPNEYYDFHRECLLCELFHDPFNDDYGPFSCRCCPVFEDTGQQFCEGNVPYTRLSETSERNRTSEMFTDEAKYLESLLPHDSK